MFAGQPQVIKLATGANQKGMNNVVSTSNPAVRAIFKTPQDGQVSDVYPHFNVTIILINIITRPSVVYRY